MGEFHDFDEVDAFTVGAVGRPGQRVFLLQARRGDAKIAMVDESTAGSRHFALAEQAGREAGVDMVMSSPITVADLEELLGLSIEERRLRFPATAGRSWAALPVSVGAAMIAIAVLMIG
jgi:hypothetical protein